MFMELVIRFVIGGLLVSAFAILGDLFRPKSFAGVFGAAPSVALASLGLAYLTKDASYVSIEGRSMVVGALALMVYSVIAGRLLLSGVRPTLAVTAGALVVWLAVALGGWGLVLR